MNVDQVRNVLLTQACGAAVKLEGVLVFHV